MKCVFFLFFPFVLFCQNEASTLFFGNALIDFKSIPPSVVYPLEMNTLECATSICSQNGEILFYSNGGKSPTSNIFGGIWNKNNQIMENGVLGTDSSGCTSSFQGAIIVPFPSSLKKSNVGLYYLFTKDCIESSFSNNQYNSYLNYSIIDMNENNGLGKVIQKNTPLIPYSVADMHSTSYEPVTAILHGNNTDYWLFSYTIDSLYRLLITENGIEGFKTLVKDKGRITISPNRLFLCTDNNKIYHFNPNTGEIEFITNTGALNSLTFSPDGTKLYGIEDSKLYQCDLNQTNFLESKTYLANTNCELFLAPNNIIYLYYEEANNFLGEIRCPNEIGATCEFSFTNTLLPNVSLFAYSNVMSHYLYYQGNCVANIIENSLETKIIISPNPSYNLILVESEEELFGIDIVDCLGNLIFSEKIHEYNYTINTSNIRNGVYFIKCFTKNDNIVMKIEIEK
ncbi:MAG: T9SS type A sorting domain-containing protein [Flavobacteriia bacterium]|nr:T9SS type A sorting domain-containing protein [Flavobacteriia bacterium]